MELNKWCKLVVVAINVVFHLLITVSPSEETQSKEVKKVKELLPGSNNQLICSENMY